MQIVGAKGLGGLWAWPRNLNMKSQFSIFDSFRDIYDQINDFLKFVGVKEGVSNFFLGF